MPDIFLSYNREDQPIARRFAEAFAAEGFEVWWDTTLRAGEAYDEVTEAALREARAVVVLWSPRSVVSRWVRAEATLADRNKTLLPVTIEPCERPIMFELTQTVDLAGWSGDASAPAWRDLVEDVRRFVAKGAPERPRPVVAAPSPPPAKTGGRKGGLPSLAVLPFANRSGLAEDEIFADGMVQDIIDAMSQGVEVRVISSSATARYRQGALPDLAAMARDLGVRYVLEGNVRRAGAMLRVTTQLVDAAGGAVLWTQRFERPLEQLASMQEDLVLEVAARLRTQSHRLEIERALRKPGDLTAWEAVWRTMAALRRADLFEAVAEAQRAVEIAPDYALAIASLAQVQGIFYYHASPDNPDETNRIRELAQRAIRLDPDNSVVLSTAAGALACIGHPGEAFDAARRAVTLNPNNEFGHFVRGMAAAIQGRGDEALAAFDEEARLAPDHPMSWNSQVWRALVHLGEGRVEAAMAAVDVALNMTPDNANPNMARAVICSAAGRREEAVRALHNARRVDPHTPLTLWELRYRRTYQGSAFRDQAVEHLRAVWAQADAA